MISVSDLSRMVDLPMAALFSQTGGSFWLPPPSSTHAVGVDSLFYFIFYICAFFFTLIVGVMIVFVWLYRRRPGVEPGETRNYNTPLEIFWSVIPLAIVVVIFYRGFISYMELRTSPPESYEIRVIGQKWQWIFKYPNGYIDNELHVPVDEPVRLIMTSEDVIHSLFIPAFRVKMDLVPGRYTRTWFRAIEPGEYDLWCAEYCGTEHSDMVTSVIVHEPGQFEPWLKDAANFLKRMTPVEAGKELHRRRGCAQCHSTDGTALVGPSFKGIFGKTHSFSNAGPTTVDENYLRESMLEPSAMVREGYKDQMPPYGPILSEEEIAALIEFIKSRK